jgi:hypothetical protein
VNGENNPADPVSAGNLMGLAQGSLNAGLYRFSAEFYQPSSNPPYEAYVPCTNFTYSPSLWQGAYTQMQNAYAHHLIPVVVFQQQPNACFNGYGNETTDWFDLLQYFSYYMPNFGTVCVGGSGLFADCSTNPPMYFEIGNEPDVPFASEYANKWTSIYPADFEIGSQGLYLWLNYPTNGTGHPAYSNAHILTAGMDAPDDGQCDFTNLNTMGDALYYATYYGTNPVPQQFLGTAVHPYGYMTAEQETGYWQNSDNFEINTICTNLDDVISYWRIEMNSVLNTQAQSPLLISETNFSSIPCLPEYDTIEREGPYQMDLYTWLFDHLGYYSWGSYPIRTLWFQEMDDVLGNCVGGSLPQYLGLYGGGSGGGSPNYKVLQSPYFVGAGHYIPYTCSAIFGSGNTNWTAELNSLADVLAYEPCY